MKRLLLALAAATPLVAMAQPVYERVVVVETRPLYPDRLYVCQDRNDELWDRNAVIARDRDDLERERRELERIRVALAGELSRLDTTNTAAVASYNSRSDALNVRVASLNRRVADLNGAVAFLNADSKDLVAYCSRLYVTRR